MKRTQLYLSEDTWNHLHVRARKQKTSISELVRQAVRDKYERASADRQNAMETFVGLRKNAKDIADATAYVRKLRKGRRLRRLDR
jgi:hypothetical protein